MARLEDQNVWNLSDTSAFDVWHVCTALSVWGPDWIAPDRLWLRVSMFRQLTWNQRREFELQQIKSATEVVEVASEKNMPCAEKIWQCFIWLEKFQHGYLQLFGLMRNEHHNLHGRAQPHYMEKPLLNDSFRLMKYSLALPGFNISSLAMCWGSIILLPFPTILVISAKLLILFLNSNRVVVWGTRASQKFC